MNAHGRPELYTFTNFITTLVHVYGGIAVEVLLCSSRLLDIFMAP